MKRGSILSSLVSALLVATLAACGETEDRELDAMGTIYPLAWVTQAVAGTKADAEPLTPPGVEPHDFELTPKQVVRLKSADLVVYVHGLQPAVDSNIPKDRAINAARPGERDPHVWLDPRRMQSIASRVGAELAEIDPEHATTYRANERRVVTQLEQLDTEFADGLATCESRTIVTSHAAFGHLAKRYGLTQIPIAGLDPANEPTARQLASITDLVRREGVTTVFTEELVSPAIAKTVARATGASVATLDPIEGRADSSANYLSLMRKNLQAIQKANRCQ
ncbi:MAG TPA: metal ABC transporter substrate-binding protein [Aeromicrobium sp.]|nr:metal ABC transporter substrate-binding protein [Aeromicrobium sp.]HKY58834.1 metal ABC transporter substrate-binding protein [Aeromicrobium sp.]